MPCRAKWGARVATGKGKMLKGALALLCALALVFAVGKSYLNAGAARLPVVYFSLDDGPSPVTAKVLDVLKEQGVKATFFVMANTQEYAAPLYRRIVEEGHALGIHTYSHRPDLIYRSMDAFLADFQKINRFLQEETGQHPAICRIPGGTNSLLCGKSMKVRILGYFSQNGYACFDWDVDVQDSGTYALPSAELAARVMKQAGKRMGEDMVILLHDDGMRVSLPGALAVLIPWFKENGYEFGVLHKDLHLPSRKA